MDSFWTAMWLTIITATTIGYGAIYACTPLGRAVTIFIIFFGAVITALLIAVMSESFEIQPNKKTAIVKINSRTHAARAITHALRYNMILNRRYRPQNALNDYVPSFAEVRAYKRTMERVVETFAQVRQASQDLVADNEQEAELKLVKEQILDIGDKFDALLVEIRQSKVLKKKRVEEDADDLKSEYSSADTRRKLKLEILEEIMRDARALDLQERSKLRSSATSNRYSGRIADHLQQKAELEKDMSMMNTSVDKSSDNLNVVTKKIRTQGRNSIRMQIPLDL